MRTKLLSTICAASMIMSACGVTPIAVLADEKEAAATTELTYMDGENEFTTYKYETANPNKILALANDVVLGSGTVTITFKLDAPNQECGYRAGFEIAGKTIFINGMMNASGTNRGDWPGNNPNQYFINYKPEQEATGTYIITLNEDGNATKITCTLADSVGTVGPKDIVLDGTQSIREIKVVSEDRSAATRPGRITLSDFNAVYTPSTEPEEPDPTPTIDPGTPMISNNDENILKDMDVVSSGSVKLNTEQTSADNGYYTVDYTGASYWGGVEFSGNLTEYTKYEFSMKIYNPNNNKESYKVKVGGTSAECETSPIDEVTVQPGEWVTYSGTFDLLTYANNDSAKAVFQITGDRGNMSAANFYVSDICLKVVYAEVTASNADVTQVMPDGVSDGLFTGDDGSKAAAYTFSIDGETDRTITGVSVQLGEDTQTKSGLNLTLGGGEALFGIVVGLTEETLAPDVNDFIVTVK